MSFASSRAAVWCSGSPFGVTHVRTNPLRLVTTPVRSDSRLWSECFSLFQNGASFLNWPCTKVTRQQLSISGHLQRTTRPSDKQEEKAGHFVREITNSHSFANQHCSGRKLEYAHIGDDSRDVAARFRSSSRANHIFAGSVFDNPEQQLDHVADPDQP